MPCGTRRATLFVNTLLLSACLQAQPHYDALLEQARAGHYQPALSFLRGQVGGWASPRYLSDHLLIAGWAGEDAEVVRLYEGYGAQVALPADVLTGVARAYRNLRLWQPALAVYERGLTRFPDHPPMALGQVLVMADAGQTQQAVRRGLRLVQQAPQDAERRLALGYAHLRDGQPHAALFQIDRARELAPQRSDVASEYLTALQRAGLAEQALAFALAHPELLDAARQRQLQADALAALVRMADMATRGEAERFRLADQALAEAERLLQAWAELPQARPDSLRVRIDRLGALHARVRMAELLEHYRQLQAEGVELPGYALRWVASALLYLREPEQAAALYRRVISGENDKHPLWLADHQGLFYALVESEQLEEAHRLATRLAAQQPPRLYQPGNPEAEPNARWLEAQVMQANAELYLNDTPAATQAFAQLAGNAPNNSSLRTSLASLYQVRGWPRRAEDELKVVESTAARHLGLEVQQGLGALQLQEWRQLDLLTDDVIRRYPENLQAQRLDKLRRVHHMAELRITAYRGLGSGSSVSGGHDLGIDSVLYSEPLHDDWRLFGGAGYASADFEEGRGHHRWQRGGLEWRVRNQRLEAEVSRHDYGHGDKLGLRLNGWHDIDDHWQYGWSAQSLSSETPLRALNADISADSLSGFLRWRADERREWRASLAAAHFSDGNDRLGLLLAGSERLYTAPTWQADLGLEFSAAHNSGSADVPYFNPAAEFGVLPSLSLSHSLYRRYQTAWSQQLQLGLGSNSQRDYGSAAVGLIGYGQRLRLDDRFDGGITVSALSREYDGDREREMSVLLDLNYRF